MAPPRRQKTDTDLASAKNGAPETVSVAELLREVRHVEVQCRRLVSGFIAGGYRSVFRGAGVEFDEVREYVEGDDPRDVDWNVTARTGRPFVKKYVDERQLTVLLLLDLSASTSGGFGAWSVRHMAARVSACLALSALRNNDRVGLIGFSEQVDFVTPPKRGMSHALRIIRDCLAWVPRSPGTDLAPPLELAARIVSSGAVVFLVSDFQAKGFEDALARCSRRHDVVGVRLSPPELKAPPRGLLRVRDPETGFQDVIDASSQNVRNAFAKAVAHSRIITEGILSRSRVDLIDVPIPETPDRLAIMRPLLRFFRMRELRSTKR